MNLKKTLNALASVAVTVARDFTPHGQAIATLIASVNELTGRKIPLSLPNIDYHADADGDGIEDRVDPDNGTVAAVTDEMIKAGAEAMREHYENGGGDQTDEIPYTRIYFAMYNARPR